MSRGPDAATLLERALGHAAMTAGIAMTVEAADWSRWASATFTGARHELRISALHSEAVDQWLAALPEHEFALRGHVVADLHVVRSQRDAGRQIVQIEALTVEER